MNLVENVRNGKPAPFDVYDMHAHLGRFSYGMPTVDPSSIVAVMDRLGVRSTIFSHLLCIGRDAHWGNDKVYQAMQAHPGRVLGYIVVYPTNERDVQAESELRISQGFTGFKFHSGNGFAYDDPAYAPAWKLADKYNMPILYHTWGERATMDQIIYVAHQAPNASILLGHSTSCNRAEYLRAINAASNIYFELCTSSCPLGAVDELVEQVGAERIVWGSDCDFYSMEQQFGRIAGSHLPEDVKQQIFSINAKNILAKRK